MLEFVFWNGLISCLDAKFFFKSTLLQCRSVNNTRSVWIFVCYLRGFFYIFGPSVTSLGPCCANRGLHTSYFLHFWSLENAVCQRRQLYMVLLRPCDSQPRLRYQNHFYRQVKLFGFLCFVLFVSSNFCDYPIVDTLSSHPHFSLVECKNAHKCATFTSPWCCSAF